jgi:hypothetical protein
VLPQIFKKTLLQIIYFIFLNYFDIHIKNNFKKIKKNILIHF